MNSTISNSGAYVYRDVNNQLHSQDMLWQWVPVVSLAAWGAGRMPSRVASSILTHLVDPMSPKTDEGPNTLQPYHSIAYSVAEYEDIVVRYYFPH